MGKFYKGKWFHDVMGRTAVAGDSCVYCNATLLYSGQLSLFRCMQNYTFSFSMQTEDVNIKRKSYKWTSYSSHTSH